MQSANAQHLEEQIAARKELEDTQNKHLEEITALKT